MKKFLYSTAAIIHMLASTLHAEEPGKTAISPAQPATDNPAPMMTLTPAPASETSTPPRMPSDGAPASESPAIRTIAPPAMGSPPFTTDPKSTSVEAPEVTAPAASVPPPNLLPTLEAINNATLGSSREKAEVSPAVLRAEVMLDRLHASPGVIDGRSGANFLHALQVYEKVKGLKVTDGLDEQVWSSLTSESGTPVVMEYTLTDKDVAGPFYPDLPQDYAKLAALPSIGYRSPSQKIGAAFHMSEDLLAALNPGVDLSKAGSKIVVADVRTAPVREKVARIVVDKEKAQVLGLGRRGQVLVAFPATIGSEELPSPSGTYKIKGVAYDPIYYYDPKNFLQGNNKEKLKLPAGPNNPVGSVFIALTKPTYGLHGTPDPSKIDKTASHGCVRMTNWDANALAHLVKAGVVVEFKS